MRNPNYKIKKIMFYYDNYEGSWSEKETNPGDLLFKARQWYEPIFQTEDHIIYLIAENGEKIAIDTKENPDLFCIQKE